MQTHFLNRERPLWTHPAGMNDEDQQLAAALVSSRPVQEAIDRLESLLPDDLRTTVACVVVVPEEPVIGKLLIELRGPSRPLARIRDRVAPGLVVFRPDFRQFERHVLRVPVAAVNCLA